MNIYWTFSIPFTTFYSTVRAERVLFGFAGKCVRKCISMSFIYLFTLIKASVSHKNVSKALKSINKRVHKMRMEKVKTD